MSIKLLRVDGSMRTREYSRSRRLTDALIESMQQKHSEISVKTRDLTTGVPFVHEQWIDANFTEPGARNTEQRAVLSQSDALMNELVEADILVLGTPIYNFSVPAAVKAWIDMVVRANETFHYTSEGPEGLLKNKKAFAIVVSGGTSIDSDIDFSTPYLRHILSFIGITDLTVIGSSLAGLDEDTAHQKALDLIRIAVI